MTVIFHEIISAGLLLVMAPLVAGVIKKLKAVLQNRRGPRVLQPYYDLYKLLYKDSVVSPTTSWIFQAAPPVYWGAAVAAAGMVAFAGPFAPWADLFILFYCLALGRFFLALASLDAGSAFGGMGGSREMYLSVLVEPAILLSMFTVAGRSGGTGLASLLKTAAGTPFSLPYILAAIAFFIVLTAETGRIPVDNPDTHLELTMIHEGMLLEYSGKALGLILWASMLKQLVMLVLFAAFFLPWTPSGWEDGWQSSLWFAGKIGLAAGLLALAETSANKMRLFRLPGFLAVSYLLSLLALIAQ